ncbi:modular serine protease-like [Contarinia nasturtii]|uniref:modular serine protease-like n=1 Tax=Contarinia nasturtii TaxID=265458 RepID=UPI0012D3D1EC|nr:modular serine protease-like [Contarinia nasturtii]
MFLLQFLAFLLTITIVLTQSEVNFICKSGHLLSGIERVCDGIAQCYDGSDELIDFCAHTLCPPEYFRCNYGACVPRSKKCNGIRDCVDLSDETNCGRKQDSCSPTEFYCGDNGDDTDSYEYCIESSKICDQQHDCWNGADEDKTICENALCPEKTFRCRYGGCISETVLCDGFYDCLDGSDESQELCIILKCPKCTKFLVSCPPFVEQNIVSKRLLKKCMWNGRQLPCAQSILPGTKVTYACKDNFKPKSTKDLSNDWNLCQADGTWLRDILKCKPDCGRLSAGIPLITNEEKLPQTMPWHASIYVVENVSKPKYICGATLISEAVVVTVAHCVWKYKAEDLRIVMGNLKSEFEDPDDFLARYFEVRDIFVHEIYLDQFANYGSDIALLELLKAVEIDEVIAPVCIDANFDSVNDEELGMVVALSMIDNSNASRSLHIKSIPIISHQKCVERQTSEFRKYLSITKFCAGWANGTSVCNGDSGAGLTIRKSDGRHYLQGIVSISPRKQSTDHCDPNQYTIFTKVGIYVKWIENYLKHINERYNPQLSTDDTSDDNAST